MEVFSGSDMLHREEILEEVISHFPSSPLVTTTGFTSREMFELRVQKGGVSKPFMRFEWEKGRDTA